MANNNNSSNNPHEGLADDFFEQILAVPSYSDPAFGAHDGNLALTSGGAAGGGGGGGGGSGYMSMGMGMPLGLNLEHGFLKARDQSGATNNAAAAAASSSCGITVSFLLQGMDLFALSLFSSLLLFPFHFCASSGLELSCGNHGTGFPVELLFFMEKFSFALFGW